MADASKVEYRYEPDVVLPPGETLAEVLGEMGMSQTELARRTGLSQKHINQIVNAGAAITPETALLLEKTTGVSARVWNNLETAFREYESRQVERTAFKGDVEWLKHLPVKELMERDCIPRAKDPVDQVRAVCRFFGVANRAAWSEVWEKPTAFRKSKAFVSAPGAVAAWLRIGELRATRTECESFDRERLVKSLSTLRGFTCEQEPRIWWPKLQETCSKFGVVVVAEPEIRGARVNGAARWLTPEKALVQLSLRHRWSDIFWFTFFHEIGHVLQHSKKEAFINDEGSHSGVEQEADAFASLVLIPRKFEAQLAQIQTPNEAKQLAQAIGVAPGIVVGRLQHDGRWPFNRGTELKQRLVFAPE